VLGVLFNPVEVSAVRVASLIEKRHASVRLQAELLMSRRKDKSQYKEKGLSDEKYSLGVGLFQFMLERNVIEYVPNVELQTPQVIKKKGSYFIPKYNYVTCTFDMSLLPTKLNLPMVCKPVEWCSATGEIPQTLSDLTGGYLSSPTGEIYDRYRLLSTIDHNHFGIILGTNDDYLKLCGVMNKLQSQPFEINRIWLEFFHKYDDLLVAEGYLMKRELASLKLKEVSDELRNFYMDDTEVHKICSYSDMVSTLCKCLQRARYEDMLLKLADAYNGYQFYLPAFLDFRGIIYRSGVLHFHERDLARSLILFSTKNIKVLNDDSIFKEFMLANSFLYFAFDTVNAAKYWLDVNLDSFNMIRDTIMFAKDAKNPLQFIATINSILYCFQHKCNPSCIPLAQEAYASIPITQDASASAYQIMSYFLLDEGLAKSTNLIPDPHEIIHDIYTHILHELEKYIKSEMPDWKLSRTVCNQFTRKIVKGIFMPIIYGKTLMSTAISIHDSLYKFLSYKESFEVAKVCFQFWKKKYRGLESLIQLIRGIGWIAAARDRPVYYRVKYFTTLQDYMVMEPIKIMVYDRIHKTKRQVSMRVSTSKRDRRKTEISTFVNFIHQKDAYIAMSVVEEMLSMGAPIYTVHDNFISTAPYHQYIAKVYTGVFCNMGPPLSIINEFIYQNLIAPLPICPVGLK